MKLSVLMSVYYKENPIFFDEAFESIWFKQTVKPDQIVLVKDGPLTRELDEVINKWANILENILKIVSLPENRGLAYALSKGLHHCKYTYIARVDTDDINAPERFERQVNFLNCHPDVDVVGTYLSEIDENGDIIKSEVKYPLHHEELFKFFSKRDPLAHPSVLFRKNFFIKAGSYSPDIPMGEDTLLWYQGFKNGCRFSNISYVGVFFRRTTNFYKRRANWKKSIILLRFRLCKINRGLNYGFKADIYAILYFLMSISPSWLKKIVYQYFR
ncbi:glycosyl transferase [Gallibacterium salpingitidis]|uniref:glycosyltransferase n=1 Tax=Gallibacterium salpingitidis TaxID=505341 RepID=UPI00080592AD|nr:glycosyltransferase [Gallibacterium salpingitidis]OBX06568.1 glycosyl transferase [Gallibacterium salpingitidis]